MYHEILWISMKIHENPLRIPLFHLIPLLNQRPCRRCDTGGVGVLETPGLEAEDCWTGGCHALCAPEELASHWGFGCFHGGLALVNLHKKKKLEKSPLLMGKSTMSMAIFNSKLLVYQRATMDKYGKCENCGVILGELWHDHGRVIDIFCDSSGDPWL